MATLVPKPRAPLVVAFVAVVLVGSVGLVAIATSEILATQFERDTRVAVEALMLTERIRADVERTISAGRGYILSGEPSYLDRQRVAEDLVQRDLEALKAMSRTLEGDRLLEQLGDGIAATHELYRQLDEERRQGASMEDVARHFAREAHPVRADLDQAFEEAISHRQEHIDEALAAYRRRDLDALRLGLGMMASALVLGAGLVVWSARRLSRMYQRQQEAVVAAEEAVSARQQLLATVAHDLRGPLSTTVMRASLIRRLTDVPKVVEQAQGIEAVTRRMEVLVGSLLDTANLEAGGFKVTRVEVKACELLRETAELHQSLCEAKAIRLECPLPTEDLLLHADRDRVLQVLSNLLGNAIKFTPKGGRIALALTPRGDWAEFEVRDTGPGIAPEHLPFVFTRFWKTESGESRGTGLGLFIAKSIVEAHGGRIGVTCEPGQGTSFRFTLPRARTGIASGTAKLPG